MLEEQVGKLSEQTPAPSRKDNWDKLSALSTLLSGVIIASIGIWVNHSLTSGQERAQEAQAQATTAMEQAHNDAAEKQADQALALQAAQAAASLTFQKQQASDEKELERLRMEQQKQQAGDALTQQREHDQAALQLQQTQLAKDFLPQLEAGSRSRAAALQLMATVNPREALILSETYSVTSADASLVQTSANVISQLKDSADPGVRRAAAAVETKVVIAKRIQAISNVFWGGTATRQYDYVGRMGFDFHYGGYIEGADVLYQVVSDYCNAPDAPNANRLRPFLNRIQSDYAALETDAEFRAALKSAGKDPAMQRVQDDVFEQRYWKPLQQEASNLGLKLPLSVALVYDTGLINGKGSIASFAAKATAQLGNSPAAGADEKAWSAAFLAARVAWVQKSEFPTAPFMIRPIQFFGQTLEKGNWNLDPPLVVNGITINE